MAEIGERENNREEQRQQQQQKQQQDVVTDEPPKKSVWLENREKLPELSLLRVILSPSLDTLYGAVAL